MSPRLLLSALIVALLSAGCVKQTLTEYKVVSPTTSEPPPAPVRSSDPGMQGSAGSAAFSLMDRSGYLQCPVALRAAEEAPISPDFRRQIVGYFTDYQSHLRPLIEQAKKDPQAVDRLTANARDVAGSFTPRSQKLSADPQFVAFRRQLEIVQSQVGLLTTNPLAFEGGFEQLHVTPAQRDKLDPILRNADKDLRSRQTGAFNGGNLADLAEQTINRGLQTRTALRAVLTPEQNRSWDALALPTTTSRP